jgi:hypothetical protein
MSKRAISRVSDLQIDKVSRSVARTRSGDAFSLAPRRFGLLRVAFWLWSAYLAAANFSVSLFDHVMREDTGSMIMAALFFGGTLSILLWAARSFTGEREGGTWEGLRLALFEPRDIVVLNGVRRW